MRREIANPSDKATIAFTDKLAACLAVVILGEGKYGISSDGADEGMPIFFFGGHDEWFKKEFGLNFEDALQKTEEARIAAALESVELCHERSSINDFVSRAKNIASVLRGGD